MSNCTSVYGLKTRYSGPGAELVEPQRGLHRFGIGRAPDDEHARAEVTAERVLDDAVAIDRREHVGERVLERGRDPAHAAALGRHAR